VLDGRSRVDGIAVRRDRAASAPAWSITANYTYLEPQADPARVRRSAAAPDPAAGAALQNAPTHSGSLFTTYTLPFGLQHGVWRHLSGQLSR
jgi:catecholate siderophore receptor